MLFFPFVLFSCSKPRRCPMLSSSSIQWQATQHISLDLRIWYILSHLPLHPSFFLSISSSSSSSFWTIVIGAKLSYWFLVQLMDGWLSWLTTEVFHSASRLFVCTLRFSYHFNLFCFLLSRPVLLEAEFILAGSLAAPCIHGTPSAPGSDGMSTCICNVNFAGPTCNTSMSPLSTRVLLFSFSLILLCAHRRNVVN